MLPLVGRGQHQRQDGAENQFPPPTPKARCRFGQATFPGRIPGARRAEFRPSGSHPETGGPVPPRRASPWLSSRPTRTFHKSRGSFVNLPRYRHTAKSPSSGAHTIEIGHARTGNNAGPQDGRLGAKTQCRVGSRCMGLAGTIVLAVAVQRAECPGGSNIINQLFMTERMGARIQWERVDYTPLVTAPIPLSQ